MEGLPRPELPPGPHRDLVDALHALHHEAGWPSLRAMAREAGCSHTTVSTVFSTPRVPSWGVLELVVEALDGDVGQFRRRWLAATAPAAPGPDGAPVAVPVALPIAGRRSELAAVRRHLDAGTGLLLVTGEAGIGKSRLVDTATALAADVFVARGACLPLSSQVPLLPVADALRCLYEVDGRQRLEEALAGCPPYVGAALCRLLPELEELVPAHAVPDDEWWRQRLFAAVEATLSALAGVSPTAVLLEDLHWADSATLDLVEHLLSRAPPLPLVGTYRRGDPATPAATSDWRDRVQRLPSVTALELGPLAREESAELLELLGVEPDATEVDRVHERSGGLPLFTEQLAAATDAAELPGPLADLLDRRLGDIGEDEWLVARALGVADRPLGAGQLWTLTGLASDDLTAALHALDRRHLTETDEHEVRLRHLLLAEAVRRRLVAGEAVEVHRRLALTLADEDDPSPAEVAEHWRCAGQPGPELVWRIRAAQQAGLRFAAAHEADQWRRALELWPDDAERAGQPPVRKADAYVAAIDALEDIDWSAAAAVADQAMAVLTDTHDPAVAEVHGRAGSIRGTLGDPVAGLELVDRALDMLDPDRHPAERARVLLSRAYLLQGLDRLDESARACVLAAELSEGRDPVTYRAALVGRAGQDAEAGRLEPALECIRAAARVDAGEPDPGGDLFVAVNHTHLLLTACRDADEVAAAGRPGLEAAAAWGIDDFRTSVLLGNLAEALRRAGRVREAARLIDPVTEGPPQPHQWPTYRERGMLDLLRGRREEATRVLDAVSELFVIDLADRVLCAQGAPTADLWCGRPQRAYDRLTAVLRDVVAVHDPQADVAGLLALAARAAADLAGAPMADPRLRRAFRDELDDFAARTARDPFTAPDLRANRTALRATWEAEVGRLSGSSSLDRWAVAAGEWDRLHQPHAAAYCRWRGAQTALATGHATAATRLLRRAEREAREHVPLLESIRATLVLSTVAE